MACHRCKSYSSVLLLPLQDQTATSTLRQREGIADMQELIQIPAANATVAGTTPPLVRHGASTEWGIQVRFLVIFKPIVD